MNKVTKAQKKLHEVLHARGMIGKYDDYEAEQIIKSLHAAGYQLAPLEPTAEMLLAGRREIAKKQGFSEPYNLKMAKDTYCSMLEMARETK